MKKFRLLATMVITVAMLFTVALAADVSIDAIEYDGTADTIEVAVKSGITATIDQFSAFYLDYDNSIFSVNAISDTANTTDAAGTITWSNTGAAANLTEGTAIYTVTFNVLNKAAVVGETFTIRDDDNTLMWITGGDAANFTYTSAAITSAAPAHKDAEVAVAERTAEFTGASGQVYTNVWVGTYTVTFNDDAVTGIKLAFNGKEETVAVEGAGTAVVDVAIVGKAGDVNVSVVKQ